MVKESAVFITGCQARSPGHLVLTKSEHLEGFQGKVFKSRVREVSCGVCDQLMDILLAEWW